MLRFPNVTWWCDSCGANLNCQEGFDDHKYVWKCTECGYKNSISKDNIFVEQENYPGVPSDDDDSCDDSDGGFLGGLFRRFF